MLHYGDDVYNCPRCGLATNPTHRLNETQATKAQANMISGSLESLTPAGKGGPTLRKTRAVLSSISEALDISAAYTQGFMFGVLQTRNGFLAAVAGFSADIPETFFTACSLVPIQAVDLELPERGLRCVSGGRIDTALIYQVDNVPLRCAAPILIQYALQNNLGLVAMTEQWFQPGSPGHRASRESCRTCQNILPAMLCPTH